MPTFHHSQFAATYFDVNLSTFLKARTDDKSKTSSDDRPIVAVEADDIHMMGHPNGAFVWSQVTTFATPIVAMLTEIGDCSNAFYSVPLNHRQVDPSNYYESKYDVVHKKETTPMLHSFLVPSPEEGWTVVTPISFYFVSIEVGEPNSYLSSFVTPITHTHYSNEHGMQKNAGVLSDRRAGFVTYDQLDRLYELFGVKRDPDNASLKNSHSVAWNANVEGTPSSYEYCKFLSIFKGKQMDWSTIEKFKKFLKQFACTGYKYQTKLSLRQNICLFFKYVQSFIPIRATVPDGQHRWMLYDQLMRGVFEITPKIPLRCWWKINSWPGPGPMKQDLTRCEYFLGK